MENTRKHDFLNLWLTAILSFISIGFTLCLGSIQLKYFNPLNKLFAWSHFFVFPSVMFVFAFIIYSLGNYILSLKYDQFEDNISLEIIISLVLCLLSLTGVVFDFLEFKYVIYIAVLFLISFCLFISFELQDDIKYIGLCLAVLSFVFLTLSLLLRYYEI
ncbi:membrane hypothetical protein [Candidatus Magnetomoraceae bacterium gMMP-15]